MFSVRRYCHDIFPQRGSRYDTISQQYMLHIEQSVSITLKNKNTPKKAKNIDDSL